MKNTFLPACIHADRQAPNANHNQSKWRKETLLRGNKRKHGLCGRDNEAEASFLLQLLKSVALCILWIYLIQVGIEPKETAHFNSEYEVHAYMQRTCISNMVCFQWIKPAAPIEQCPKTLYTQGNWSARDHWVQSYLTFVGQSTDRSFVLPSEITVGPSDSHNKLKKSLFFPVNHLILPTEIHDTHNESSPYFNHIPQKLWALRIIWKKKIPHFIPNKRWSTLQIF